MASVWATRKAVACHVTAADIVFGAARERWEFFQDSFWRGPKPNLKTVFEISLVGDDRRWFVKAGAAVPVTTNSVLSR